MNYFVLLLELWILLFICVSIGRRLVDLLPNVMRRTIGFYVAPILGLAILVIFVTGYGWLSSFQFRYSVVLASGLTIFSIVFEKQKYLFLKDWLYVCLFASLASLPILAPIIRFGGYNPFTDIFTYLVHGQWLQTHSFSEKTMATGFYPTLSQVTVYQGPGLRMGGSFLLGYVQSLFRLEWSYYAYLPTISLGFVTGCLALGGVIRQVIPERKTVILGLSAMPCFLMGGYVFGAEWGFFPQTFGLAFAAGISALFPLLITDAIKNSYSWNRTAIHTLPLSVCIAALLFAYNEPFPIFVIAVGLFFLLVVAFYRKKGSKLLVLLGLVVTEVIIIVNYEGARIAKSFIQTLTIADGQSAIGWPVPWTPIQFLSYAFGWKSPLTTKLFSIDYWISTFFFPMFFIAMCVFFFKFMRKVTKRNITLFFLFSIDFVLLLVFLKFRYFAPNLSPSEVGHTFLQYKVAKYASLFSMALVGVFLASLWHEYKKLRLFFLPLYLAVMGFGLFSHLYTMASAFHQNFLDEMHLEKKPFNGLLQLRSVLAAIPNDQVIYIALGEQHSKLRQMVAYILYDRKISSDYRDDGYILGSLPMEDRNMSSNGASYMLVMKSFSNISENEDQKVGPFVLLKAPFNYIVLEKTENGYATESNRDGETWNWVTNSIDFYFTNVGKPRKVKIKFKIASHAQSRTFVIRLKNSTGRLLATYKLVGQAGEKIFESPWVKTNSQRLLLHVEADGQPARLSDGDSREVKFVIANVGVVVN